MITWSCLLPIFISISLFQLVTSNPNCSIIEGRLAVHIGNRVIPNRRLDRNACANMHDSVSNACCSREMLVTIAEISRHEVGKLLKNFLEKASENFCNDTIALKSFVVDTLGTTMEQLHSQLRSDLSSRFRAHEQFLINFFSTLQSYLSGNVNGLSHLMASFFDQLLLKVTQILLNTNTTDTYTKCVVDALRSKQPFLRIPGIITNMTMEAFPPVRAAINSMAFARETLLAASITLNPPQECFDDYQRLRFCYLCAGITTTNSCESSCDRLAETCVPQQRALGAQWRTFISALQEVMNLLDKFPKVHRPLQMHLTDAIMNLKSVYTRYEQEITSNCSSSSPHSPPSATISGGHWSLRGHLRSRRQSSSLPYHPPIMYQQPIQPLLVETRPLPAVTLGEQNIARLQAWVRDVNHRYDEMTYLFDNMGSEMCNSKTPKSLLTATFTPSSTCWNGSSLVPSITMKSDARRQSEMITDPTLRQKELGLRKAVSSLQSVARSMLVDPEILQLADPAATILKVGRNGLPVMSDDEALRSYLNSPEAAAATSPWGVQTMLSGPPFKNDDAIGGMGLGSDTEVDAEGSGYGVDGLPLPNSDSLASLSRSDHNNRPIDSISPPLSDFDIPSKSTFPVPGHSPAPSPHNFANREDDEDFPSKIENSGYEPADGYRFPAAKKPAWPIQPQAPFDTSSGLPPTDWDAESDLPEDDSNSASLGTSFDLEASPEWTGAPPSPPSPPSSVQTGDLGLVVGEGKMQIPDQIWVPEGDGIVQQYPDPSHTLTTTGVSTLASSPLFSLLLPIVASVITLTTLRR